MTIPWSIIKQLNYDRTMTEEVVADEKDGRPPKNFIP
jgi:hypothetical protein